MLPHIVKHYGDQRRIVEPFFGGGAVSFHLASRHAGLEVVANDHLSAVMEVYAAIKDDVERFIRLVDVYADPYLKLDKADRRAFYYALRERYMTEEVDGPAPLFVMLWCAYSGMYRTGKRYPGRFNTSHGFGAEKPAFYHPDNLRAASRVMQTWTLSSGDFAALLDQVDADTFVYLDPPYRDTYTGYTDAGFCEQDQLRLVEFFDAAAARGAQVVYTNKDTGDGFYDEHFSGRHIERVPIRYQVNRNCATVGRPETFEVVVATG